MKKISYLIVFVLSIFIFSNVNAETFNVTHKDLKGPSGLYLGDMDDSSYNKTFYITVYNANYLGTNYSAFCLDPGLRTNTTYTTSVDLSSSSRRGLEEYDYGLKTILINGYNINNTTTTNPVTGSNLTADEFKVATTIALRSYVLAWGSFNSSSVLTEEKSAYINETALWNYNAAEDGIFDTQRFEWISNEKIGLNSSKNFDDYDSSINFNSSSEVGEGVFQVARELYYDGMDAATKYATTSQLSPDVVNTSRDVTNDDDSITRTITLTPTNFNGKTGTLTSLRVSGVSGVSYKISKNGSESTLTSFSNVTLDENTKIIITFTVTPQTGKNVDYNLNYSFNHEDLDSGRFILLGEGQANVQRLLLYVPGDTSKVFNDEFTIVGDVACKTEIDIPGACSNYDDEHFTGEINGPEDIKNCVIDGQDEAGNSYQAETCDDNIIPSDSNDYCQVYCTEDFEIEFPGMRPVNSGRYFDIGAQIVATKSCYTSEIDHDQFDEDIENAINAVIAAYNRYSEASAVVEGLNSSYIGTKKYDDKVTYFSYDAGRPEKTKQECTESIKDGETVETCRTVVTQSYIAPHCDRDGSGTHDANECGDRIVPSKSYTTYYISNGVLQSRTENTSSKTYDGDDGNTYSNGIMSSCNDRVSSCDNGSIPSSVTSAANSEKSSAKTALDNAINAYNAIINDYKLCSDWDYSYDSVPEITYSYESKYDNLLSGSDRKMDSDSSRLDVDTYECDENYENCGTLDKETVSYITCTTSGCTTTSYQLNRDAGIVKKTGDKTIDYETPEIFYQYWPSGEVFIEDEGYVNSSNTGTVSTVDGLPVEIEHNAGAYDFVFTIDGLGEYYDDCGEDGRIINESDPSGTVLEKNETAFEGEYVCQYLVNCPECEFDVTYIPDPDECTNCLFTAGYLQAHYRPTSVGSLTANDREMGWNWNRNDGTFLGEKAGDTLDDIINNGDSVYLGTPLLTVNLTADLAADIRMYNDREEKNGGYKNNSLKCIDSGSYENVMCYSTFFDDYLEHSTYNTLFVFGNDRDDIGTYFQLYTGASIPGGSTGIGGPSWKLNEEVELG